MPESIALSTREGWLHYCGRKAILPSIYQPFTAYAFEDRSFDNFHIHTLPKPVLCSKPPRAPQYPSIDDPIQVIRDQRHGYQGRQVPRSGLCRRLPRHHGHPIRGGRGEEASPKDRPLPHAYDMADVPYELHGQDKHRQCKDCRDERGSPS
jgi:hypothetical protein